LVSHIVGREDGESICIFADCSRLTSKDEIARIIIAIRRGAGSIHFDTLDGLSDSVGDGRGEDLSSPDPRQTGAIDAAKNLGDVWQGELFPLTSVAEVPSLSAFSALASQVGYARLKLFPLVAKRRSIRKP
jgi:hypothetical protein